LGTEVSPPINPQSSQQIIFKPVLESIKHTPEDKKNAMQEIRDLLAGFAG